MTDNFERTKLQPEDGFKRDTGVSLPKFLTIVEMVKNKIEEDFVKNPNKTKGVKPSITVENKVLLTFHYIRHYPTFKNLGNEFGISESYANKIYHSILNILIETLHVKGNKVLTEKDLDTIVIDVTEQQIERPVNNQKAYYSGKKKAYN